jgi:uncharacterized membrane protein
MKANRIEQILGIVLLGGVLSSAGFVLTGGAVYVTRHGLDRVHYRVFRGERSDLRSFRGVVSDAREFSGRGIILLGLMLLVAVQVIRVGLTCCLFAWNRDRPFVLISLLVLVMLFYGIFFEGR